ncbi:NAD(P)-binding domain-containing protein, partial [Stenotrophomonas maltophilia]|uniref:NAD(P)-binding domain-containing protein n=1 Tax=Stenotrophomonas maltophilia TaxID=40324 RepID=UPI0013DAD0C6
MAERPRIGWIGLGNMGSRMAPHLIKAGYDVAVFDVDPARMAELVAAGAATAGSPGELGAGRD